MSFSLGLIDIFSLPTGIPKYYIQLWSRGDKFIEHSRESLERRKEKRTNSKMNCISIPISATVREEYVKCGRSCLMCPHGPYYYAYWKDKGKMKKKYVGTEYDKNWNNQLTVKEVTKWVQKPSNLDL